MVVSHVVVLFENQRDKLVNFTVWLEQQPDPSPQREKKIVPVVMYSQGQSNRKISIFVKPPNRPVRFIFYIFRATLQVIWFLKGS